MQPPAPVGISTPPSVVGPPSFWTSDVRYRSNLLNAASQLNLTAGFQSVGLSIPTTPGQVLLARWKIILGGAVGATTGVAVKLVSTNSSSGGSLITVRGPIGSFIALGQSDVLLNIATGSFFTFDISSGIGTLDVTAFLGGSRVSGIFDLQMQLSGAGVYSVIQGFVEAGLA